MVASGEIFTLTKNKCYIMVPDSFDQLCSR